MTNEETRTIKEKCSGCKHGAYKGSGVFCYHMHGAGWVGGWGTEWALHCPDYVARGKKMRIKEVLVEEEE